jgi:hypothetical protein
MKKILLISLLVSTSCVLSNQSYAYDYYQGSQRVIDTYAPPKVIYVVPLNNGYAPQPLAPSISPSTYVAPSNTWTPIVTPTPTIDLSPNK